MNDEERFKLIAAMGANIGAIDQAIKGRDVAGAHSCFVAFMAAAGFLAQEISELDNANAN
jgi:hypothetical protein